MITVVSGTNRPGSISGKIAELYLQMLENEGAEVQLVDLRDLPRDIAFAETYGERTTDYEQKFVRSIADSDKFVFVIPEYNGGFPGVLKLFIDSVPPKFFHNKKAGLIGLSSGRGGASRAMDQFSNVLNYLRVDVIAEKPKLSGIEESIDDEAILIDKNYLKLLELHCKKILSF